MESGQRQLSRRTMRSSQTPKVSSWATEIILIGVFLATAITIITWNTHTASQSTDTVSQPRALKLVDGEIYRGNASQTYFQKYCKGQQSGADCREEEMMMLEGLLEIISRDHALEEVTRQTEGERHDNVGEVAGLGMSWDQLLERRQEQLVAYTLEVVQNQQLTTSKAQQRSLFNSIRQMVFPIHPYQGISRVLEEGPHYWEVSTHYPLLTLTSLQPIRPHFLHIDSGSPRPEQLYLAGLLFTLEQELVAVKLGSYEVLPGVNLIRCRGDNCGQEFSMLLLKMSSLRVRGPRVYEKVVV